MALVTGIGLVYYFTTYGGIFAKAGLAAGGSISVGGPITITAGESAQGTDWEVIVSQIATRLGAVFIAIFIMQFLVSFARYKFRLSDNLAKMADICEVSNGNLESMKILSQIYLLDIGDVTQFLQSPTDKMIELARDALAKVPKGI
jgi:hypothetical protein